MKAEVFLCKNKQCYVIDSGGTKLTVEGRNLDYVAGPTLKLTITPSARPAARKKRQAPALVILQAVGILCGLVLIACDNLVYFPLFIYFFCILVTINVLLCCV